MSSWLPDLLVRLNSMEEARHTQDLLSTYLNAATMIGDIYITIIELSRAEAQMRNFIHVGYPQDWVNFYIENKYIDIDPIIKRSINISSPYTWSDLQYKNIKEKSIIRDIHEYGIQNGYTIPIHTHDGRVYSICCAFRGKYIEKDAEIYLRTLSSFFVINYKKLSSTPPIPHRVLTTREKECLKWTAKGKSSWEIGMVIGIRERTVNFHINNALVKLDCNNRIMGVVRAICLGLIDL
ncbi:autoinducer binding domain-containing protein [Komagataeibacter sp. FNDCR2]|uniref:autoinducer binding domain-containing protein n=1 Tax=Komagataeibacter sp. FNDCR2 TaxID=2878682 RepID=UPI001E3620E5|nr:autoinducer binding domain-containing protein [Komagataeibacter sp. FNDCR2]MCE2576697.1 autoinducer binding domain-containing protein [Komagataeibacter sp. FNDCR2]